jgi:hypothetical protein
MMTGGHAPEQGEQDRRGLWQTSVGILVGVAGLGAVLAPSAKAGLFAQGFALASLAASAMAGIAGALTFRYVGSSDTSAPTAHPCQAIDCRHPI